MDMVILEDKSGVTGEIYVITNTVNNKQYVGQTLSHRKNKGKYRPFGSLGRFKDHVSEAICNTKKKQCSYLNNAIRKYGPNAFIFKMIQRCPIQELDEMETLYIKKYNTTFPFGYNLTPGGKTAKIDDCDMYNPPKNTPRKRGGRDQPHTEETKKLMSMRIRELHAKTTMYADKSSEATKRQHMRNRLARFANVAHLVNRVDLHSHIRENISGCSVYLGEKKTTFHSTGRTPNSTEEALKFLNMLCLQHDQIAGNS